MKRLLAILLITITAVGVLLITYNQRRVDLVTPLVRLPIKSIDTMKYSRDLAREKRDDPSFDTVIFDQMRAIASTGATHVAIGTPYDEEFVPFLSRWVFAARREHLKVWFRGNFSGWEGWFDYPPLTMDEHTASLSAFLSKHQDLFEDGDIFTSCSECENGGSGDPRKTKRVDEYRSFLIREHSVAKTLFSKNRKQVKSGYFSMNYDVAKLIMDKPTTLALDGIVAIDHYVKDPDRLATDVSEIAKASGGKVVLGEFGAPIPDIHGNLTEEEQRVWIQTALSLLQHHPDVLGMNYWVGVGGSTAIWNTDGTPKSAVATLTDFYNSH